MAPEADTFPGKAENPVRLPVWRDIRTLFHNLRLVTQAIADAIHSGHWHSTNDSDNNPDPNRVVVGFDTRFLSDRYARDVARALMPYTFQKRAGGSASGVVRITTLSFGECTDNPLIVTGVNNESSLSRYRVRY